MYTDQFPYDQSVWFYHQYLMTNLTDVARPATIVPHLPADERIRCITQRLDSIEEFLDGGEDCKWAYIASIDATMAICQLQKRQPDQREGERLRRWMAEIRKLDPLRAGRWADLEPCLSAP